MELVPGLYQHRLDPQDAVREWLRRQPGGGAVAALLANSAAFQQFVAAGPGVKELITVGELGDLVTAGEYDVVIADETRRPGTPSRPTAPRTFAAIAGSGRIGRDAAALWDLVRDPATTAVAGVTLPEDMPVLELVELDARLVRSWGTGSTTRSSTRHGPTATRRGTRPRCAPPEARAGRPLPRAPRCRTRRAPPCRGAAAADCPLGDDEAPLTVLPELPRDRLGPASTAGWRTPAPAVAARARAA